MPLPRHNAVAVIALGVMLAMQGVRVTLALGQTPANPEGMTIANPDEICGPRCVHYILEHYGIDEELVSVVRELQGPGSERGVSLGSVQKSLEKRGVATKAIKIGMGYQLNWPEPVLVHLPGGGPMGGHYVVVIPSAEASKIRVVDGLEVAAEHNRSEFAAQMSGYALLTSRDPIGDPQQAVTFNTPRALRWLGVGFLGVVVLALAAAIGRFLLFRSSVSVVPAPLAKEN